MAQISYKNDDTEWLDSPDCYRIPSVTACLIADLFDKNIEQVTKDLLKQWNKRSYANGS
jgi:hypothetical protein